jgi:hypothetical protein
MLSNFTAFRNAVKPFAPWARRRSCEFTPSQRRVLYVSKELWQAIFHLLGTLFADTKANAAFL